MRGVPGSRISHLLVSIFYTIPIRCKQWVNGGDRPSSGRDTNIDKLPPAEIGGETDCKEMDSVTLLPKAGTNADLVKR